jgi:hypothetical protein
VGKETFYWVMENKMKKLTIDDFIAVIPWKLIEDKMGKREYKKFCKWMVGQTSLERGVFKHDLQNYLEGGQAYDD